MKNVKLANFICNLLILARNWHFLASNWQITDEIGISNTDRYLETVIFHSFFLIMKLEFYWLNWQFQGGTGNFKLEFVC